MSSSWKITFYSLPSVPWVFLGEGKTNDYGIFWMLFFEDGCNDTMLDIMIGINETVEYLFVICVHDTQHGLKAKH